MDYFAPYNRALENAGAISDNGLAQAYKLHDFETKQRAAKLEYEAKKLAYDDVKRRHDLETQAREAANNAQPKVTENVGAYQAQAPTMMPLNEQGMQFDTGMPTNQASPQAMKSQELARNGMAMFQPHTAPVDNAGQTVVNPVNKIKVYLDTVAAQDPAAAMEMKSKLYAEFAKTVPAGVSSTDAIAHFNSLFGEDYTAAPTKKDLMVAPKNSQIIDATGKVVFDNTQAATQYGDIEYTTLKNGKQVAFIRDENGKPQVIGQDVPRVIVQGGGGAAGGKPTLPPPAMNKVLEAQTALDTASRIQANTQGYIDMLSNGELKLGPVANKANATRNWSGFSNAESQNYTSFKTYLNQLRNEILTLAKGVQTDGDALRAYNTLVENINDGGVVQNQLKTIQANNANNARLQENLIKSIYNNYKQDAPDTSAFSTPPTTVRPAGKPSASRPQPPAGRKSTSDPMGIL